jgi:hypothetical protein
MKLILSILILFSLTVSANPFLGMAGSSVVSSSISTPTVRSVSRTAAASATSRSVTSPSGTANNDIVVVCLVLAASKTVTAPSGFTLLTDHTTSFPSNPHYVKIYWKREDSTPDASYSFTWSGATYAFACGVSVSGAVTSGTPIDTQTIAVANTQSKNDFPGASFTPSINNVLALWFGTNMEGGTASTPPNGWTEISDIGDSAGAPVTAASYNANTAGATVDAEKGSYSGAIANGTSSFILGIVPAAAAAMTANNVDIVIDFEESTAGTTLTDTILKSVQDGDKHGWINQKTGSSYTGMTIESTPFGSSYMPSFVVSRRSGITTGTRAMQHSHSVSGGGDGERLIIYYPGANASTATAAQVCVYALMQFNASSAAAVDIDHITVETTAGSYAVLQQELWNGNYNRIRLHTSSGDGSTVDITSGQEYWVGLNVNTTAGTVAIAVYNADTEAQVGSTLSGSIATGASSGWVLVGGGYIEGGATGTTIYDNIALQFNVTGWPLIAP